MPCSKAFLCPQVKSAVLKTICRQRWRVAFACFERAVRQKSFCCVLKRAALSTFGAQNAEFPCSNASCTLEEVVHARFVGITFKNKRVFLSVYRCAKHTYIQAPARRRAQAAYPAPKAALGGGQMLRARWRR